MLLLFDVFDVVTSGHKMNHDRYVSTILMALSEYYRLRTVLAVRKSPFFGFIIDLSSDRASHENMLVYVTFFDQETLSAELRFLCCVRLLGKDGAAIFDALQRMCNVFGLQMTEKLRTFCADGDGAMQGHRSGLVGCLRQHCNCIIAMHCAAHRHALAVSHIAPLLSILALLDKVLQSVHTLFLRRTKHVGHWEIFAKKHGITAFTFPLFVPTRWCSRAYCISRLLDKYFVLVAFLRCVTSVDAKSKLYWNSAEPVLDLLTEARTVIILSALADVHVPLERSRKLFETSGYKLSELTAELTTLFEALDHLSEAETLQQFGGKRMKALMAQSNELLINSDEFVELKVEKHAWTIK
jgi:hypothetical protein